MAVEIKAKLEICFPLLYTNNGRKLQTYLSKYYQHLYTTKILNYSDRFRKD